MSSEGGYRNHGMELAKPCTVIGCDGIMQFRRRLREADAPHTLEWQWQASWVCGKNIAHFEIASAADEREAVRRR